MELAKPCQAVLETYVALQKSLAAFATGIRQDMHLPAWISCDDPKLLPFSTQADPRENAIQAFSQLYYLDHQAPREILIMAGFVGASQHTIDLAIQLNACKTAFKSAMLALKAVKSVPDLSDPNDTDQATHRSPMAKRLHQLGLSRLHLKQCYRLIPILEAAPKKISWTWANTKAIQKITVEQAQTLLHKKGDDPGIQIQLQQLNVCHHQEPLAIVQTLAPHLRANILFHPENLTTRKMIKGPLPLLYPCETGTPLPIYQAPPNKDSAATSRRARRSDVKLESEVFLPAIRAYRYATS